MDALVSAGDPRVSTIRPGETEDQYALRVIHAEMLEHARLRGDGLYNATSETRARRLSFYDQLEAAGKLSRLEAGQRLYKVRS